MIDQNQNQLNSAVDQLESWYLREADRPFDVVTSVGRLAGSMWWYAPNGQADREQTAVNIGNFIDYVGLDRYQTFLLYPQNDFSALNIVDVDQLSDPDRNGVGYLTLPLPADMLVTRRPQTILGVTPADCPILIGSSFDRNGQEMLFMTHLGWQGLNAGFTEAAFSYLEEEGIDYNELRLYLTAGVRPESYPYRMDSDPVNNGNRKFTHPDRHMLAVDVQLGADGSYLFRVDTKGFLYHQLGKLGISRWQIFDDQSDTGLAESGYHSHSRATNRGEPSGRDLVLAFRGPSK